MAEADLGHGAGGLVFAARGLNGYGEGFGRNAGWDFGQHDFGFAVGFGRENSGRDGVACLRDYPEFIGFVGSDLGEDSGVNQRALALIVKDAAGLGGIGRFRIEAYGDCLWRGKQGGDCAFACVGVNLLPDDFSLMFKLTLEPAGLNP